MNRRTVLKRSMAFGLITAIPALAAEAFANPLHAQVHDAQKQQPTTSSPSATKAEDVEKTCLVCGMEGSSEITSVYKKKTYYFCMQDHKVAFDGSPEEYVKTAS